MSARAHPSCVKAGNHVAVGVAYASVFVCVKTAVGIEHDASFNGANVEWRLVDWGKEMGVFAEFVHARAATLIVGLDACDKRVCGDSEARFGFRCDFFEGVCGYHEVSIDPFLKNLFLWIYLRWNEMAIEHGIKHVVFKFEYVAGNGTAGFAFVGKSLAV